MSEGDFSVRLYLVPSKSLLPHPQSLDDIYPASKVKASRDDWCLKMASTANCHQGIFIWMLFKHHKALLADQCPRDKLLVCASLNVLLSRLVLGRLLSRGEGQEDLLQSGLMHAVVVHHPEQPRLLHHFEHIRQVYTGVRDLDSNQARIVSLICGWKKGISKMKIKCKCRTKKESVITEEII